jgi:hypothetical protein
MPEAPAEITTRNPGFTPSTHFLPASSAMIFFS